MLSTTPASGRSEGAQCSWKLDSSTASTSAGSCNSSSTGLPMLPHSRLLQARGDEHRVQHRRGGGLAVGPGDRQPAPRRAVMAGLVEPPGQLDVTPDRDTRGRGGGGNRRRRRKTRADHHQRVVGDVRPRRSPSRRSACRTSANCRRVAGSSSHSVAVAPSAASAASTARPVTPPPATSTGAPADSGPSGSGVIVSRRRSPRATRCRTARRPGRS